MKKLLIFIGIVLSVYFAQAQDTTEIDVKNYVNSLEQKQKQIEEGLANLQAGLENFEKKINERQAEINVWEDSIKILSVKIGTGDSVDVYEIKIDSLEKLISMNKEIIDALNDGIEDITESIEDLNESLSNIAYADNSDAYNYKDEEDYDLEDSEFYRKKFSGHWSGIQLGINTFLSPTQDLNLPQESEYMTVQLENSREFSINPVQFSIPFFNKYVGAVTGLGFTFNNYELSENIKLFVNENKQVTSVLDTEITYIKNRFKTANLTVPLLIEFQIPVSRADERLNLSVGVIGSLNISNKMKYVYYDKLGKVKIKDKNQAWNTNRFNYSATARIGYENFYFYANYEIMSLFKQGYGPEIYPVSVGIGLTFK